jgi:ribosome-binding factor A
MRRFLSPKEGGRARFAETDEGDERSLQLAQGRRPRSRHGRRHDLHDSSNDRKACQLCRQVAHVLDEVLADCGDDVLQNLRVLSVVPCPDASRLLVTVMSIDDRHADPLESKTVLGHLENAAGYLRSEVATAVTRRHAPVLVYQLGDAGPSIIR